VWNAIGNPVSRLALICAAGLWLKPIAAAERLEALEPHMGTMFRIVLYASDGARAHEAIRAAFDRIAELDSKLSDYQPESELNRVCRAAPGHDIPLSEDLYVLLKASQALADSTQGAFDVTLGPVIRVWRKARKTGQFPAPEELEAARRLSGYGKLHLGDHTLRLDQAGMQLDLGAIAKGYAADEGLRVLSGRGFPQALVAASGDLAIGEAPPGKAGWEVGVDSLNASKERFTRTLQLHHGAVSTSGDTEQYVELGGVRYSHIVNPSTGKGLTRRIGVTVLARKAIDSDALATAASVVTEMRGPAAGLSLIEQHGARGMIVTDAGGSLTEFESAQGLTGRNEAPTSPH
jgi:thiamine biosynthesis lipoprotein